MSNIIRIHEIEDPNHRLGRHIWRSGNFFAQVEAQKLVGDDIPQKTTRWTRRTPVFNQGNIGSCVGNAGTGVRMTDPFWKPGVTLTETDAVTLYSEATHFNGDPGVFYPPTDTGSSGPAAGQALERDGIIKGYGHDLTLHDTINSLMVSPGMMGIGWYDSFDTPLPTGQCVLTPGATLRGGHEIELYGCDIEQKQFQFYNSWGQGWGTIGDGSFWISFTDIEYLFTHGADATFFTV